MSELHPHHASELLRAGGEAIRAELSACTEELLRWHSAPGEWCLLETLGHILEAEERGFAGRVRVLLSQDGAQLVAWDQEAVAKNRRDCDCHPPDLIKQFHAVRQESVRLVFGLRPSDLGRGGDHPGVGRLTIGDLIHEWVHHDREHYKQILTTVQRYVWPHMGNARNFSS